MKSIISLSIYFLLLLNSLQAQKLSINHKTIQVPLTVLPGNYNLVGFDNYKILSANPKEFYIRYGMNEEQFLKSVPKLEGFNVVPYGEQFLVEIAIDEPEIKSEKVNTIKNTVNKKEVTTYSKSYNIELNVTVKVLNLNGESILSMPIHSDAPYNVMTTNTFKTLAELNIHVKKNLPEMIKTHVRSVSTRKVNEAMKLINSRIGFSNPTQNLSIYYISTKKHADYSTCNAQYEAVRNAVSNFRKNKDLSSYKNDLVEPFKYFKEGIQKYNKQDPQESKLAAAFIYNTILLAYLGDFELDVNPLATEANELGHLRKTDLSNIRFIQRQRYIMSDLGILSSNYTHASTNINLKPGAVGLGVEESESEEDDADDAIEDDEPVELEIARLFKKKASDLVVAASLILKDGRNIDGYLVIPSGDQKNECFTGAEFGFIDEKDKMKKFHIKAKELESLTFAKRTIISIDYKPYDNFGSKQAPAFAELLYTDDNISAYHVFVDDGFFMKCDNIYHVFKTSNSTEFFPVSNKDMLGKKRAKKYFEECDKVIEYIDNTKGWYGNKEANVNLAKVYSSCSL